MRAAARPTIASHLRPLHRDVSKFAPGRTPSATVRIAATRNESARAGAATCTDAELKESHGPTVDRHPGRRVKPRRSWPSLVEQMRLVDGRALPQHPARPYGPHRHHGPGGNPAARCTPRVSLTRMTASQPPGARPAGEATWSRSATRRRSYAIIGWRRRVRLDWCIWTEMVMPTIGLPVHARPAPRPASWLATGNRAGRGAA